MTDLSEIIKYVKNNLSEKRFIHTVGVAETAKDLALHYGENPLFAEMAGFLHDIAKEYTLEQMRELAKDLKVDETILNSKALMHAVAGACLAKKLFDIPEEVFNACLYHTAGRENMTTLEKIVFVADMIEPSRDFSGLDSIKALSKTDLDKAVLTSLNSTLMHLIKTGKKIHYPSVKTRNYLLT
ncbi:MAG: bis(5'-nucleosyl)-tetraphosphatase (symmetrical) YqeK [Clostridia bacterium]|nr:bis(5'-nucleosyl)-tetraphosphatase (symmetrical) YqeK [Clostridia bacterium]